MPGIFGVDEIERAIIPRKVVPVRSICGVMEKNPSASNEGTPEPMHYGEGLYFLTF